MTRHGQQVVANPRQVTLEPEDSVLFALRYELRRVMAQQVGPLPDRQIRSWSGEVEPGPLVSAGAAG